MYSLVLMTAVASSGDAASFGKRYAGCAGCYSSCSGSCYGSCYGACSGSCQGSAFSAYWAQWQPPPYGTACWGSCYGSSYQTSCYGAGYGTGYGWSTGGGGCFGGAAGCYSLWSPSGGGPGYGIWIDPNNGPTIMPPRVGHLMHGGSFYGRLYQPFSCHGASFRGAGYYDECSGTTIPAHAGGNGYGYVELYARGGGYDYTQVDDAYKFKAEDVGGPIMPPPMPPPDRQVRANVTVELPAAATLYVDGQKVAGAGATRQFHTPPLKAGTAYFYDMKAEVEIDGKAVPQTTRVVVRAGETVTAKFDELIAAAKPAGSVVAAAVTR